jgi:hypothetical protein
MRFINPNCTFGIEFWASKLPATKKSGKNEKLEALKHEIQI